GRYELLVAARDADTRAGPRCVYVVRIAPERPDFRLIVLPADDSRPDGCCLRQGGQERYTVLVWRQGGCAGPVTLTLDGLPSGVQCPPQTVGPNLRQTELVCSANAAAFAWTGAVRVLGTAVIDGRTVVREARPASITWPIPTAGIPPIGR